MLPKRFRTRKILLGLVISSVLPAGSSLAADVDGSELVDGSGAGTIAHPWAIVGNLFIGNTADGSLTVQNGADVTATGGAFLGFSAIRSGELTITGAGSTITLNNILYGGWSGTGEINILDGGSVSSANGYVGYAGDTTANVDGAGSAWTVDDSLAVGAGAIGDLSITNGGLVSSASAVLGFDPAAIGTVTVSGAGSRWLIDSDLDIGSGGTGTLLVEGGGTVASGGSILGYDFGSNGSVGLTGPGSGWSIAGDLTIGYEGTGDLTLGANAELSVDDGFGYIYLGDAVGSQGTLTLGADVGSAASGAGSIDASELIFGDGSAELVFNHTDQNYDWSLDITGSGTIRNVAGTTFLTGDLSGFSGTTIVSGGLLSTDGSLAGSLLVDDGGTLGGTGTFSNVVLASGATVAPGNSIGTLNIAGPLAFISGTIYEVEVDDLGNSDLIVATGAISIDAGATLSVLAENGTDTGATYQPSTTYTILQGASLTGSFGTISENFAYLDANVTYDATNAYLTLTRADDLLFQSRAITTNQKSVAAAISSQGSGTLFDAILLLPDDAPPAAFDALSGEIHGDIVTGIRNRGSLVRNILLGRAHTASGHAGAGQSAPVSGFLPFDRILGERPDSSTTFWTAALGSVGQVDGDGNSHGHKTAGGGLMIGADQDFGDGWHGGIATGYDAGKISQNILASDADVESYHLAAYGGRRIGPLSVSLGAVETWSGVETNRQVQFSGFSDEVSADYRSGMTQVYLEAGWNMNRDLWTVEPFGNVAFSHFRRGAYSETGGPAALEASGMSDNQWQTTLGLRIDRDIAINAMLGKLHGTIGWNHAFGDLATGTAMRFASVGNSFSIAASGTAKDTAFLGLGAHLEIAPLASVELDYKTEFSGADSNHSLTTRLSMRF